MPGETIFYKTNQVLTSKHTTSGDYLCVLMSVMNMAYPQWHPVPCSKKLYADIICEIQSETERKLSRETNNIIQCNYSNILFENSCFFFHEEILNVRKNNFKNLENFKDSVLFPLMKMKPPESGIIIVVHKVHWRFTFNFFHSFIQKKLLEEHNELDIYIYVEDTLNRTSGQQLSLFQCKNGEYLSMKAFLNRKDDCPDQEDEKGLNSCMNDTLEESKIFRRSPTKKCTCDDLHFNSRSGLCVLYEGSLYADLNTPVPTSLRGLHKTNVNCSDYAGTVNYCATKTEIPCTHGCTSCFPLPKFCVYELESDSKIKHCPGGTHLQNCTNMECNNMIKCPRSYCIPYRLAYF